VADAPRRRARNRVSPPKKRPKCARPVAWARHVEPVAFFAVLKQDARARVLEDGGVERVALLDLLPDLHVKVVVGVLRLPEAAAEVEEVALSGKMFLPLTWSFSLGRSVHPCGRAVSASNC